MRLGSFSRQKCIIRPSTRQGLANLYLHRETVHDLFYRSRDHRRGFVARLARRGSVRQGSGRRPRIAV